MQKNDVRNLGQEKLSKYNEVILNLIQDLPLKPFMNKTTLSGRFRIGVRNDFMDKQQTARVEDPGQKPSGMTLCNNGFTLIELLVVVLIIGILAAVALPQYQMAVLKTRMNNALPLMKSIKDAQEVYYLANGKYVDDLDELDINIPVGDVSNNPSSGQMCYKNGICFDNIYDWDVDRLAIVGGIGSGIYADDTCSFTVYFDHSSHPGEIKCGIYHSNHPKCAQLCKVLGY